MEFIKVVLLCATFHHFMQTFLHLQQRWEEERRACARETTLLLQLALRQNMFFKLSQRIGRKKCPKRYWVKPRSQEWWLHTVKYHFTEADWIENFRMSSSTFKYLCNRLEPYLRSSNNCVRQPIPVDKKVAIALYKLASCAEYRVVANQFGTHKSVVHKYVYEVCEAIYEEFKDEFLSLPNEVEARDISYGFESMCGLPNVIGAIDGTHIQILPPSDGYRDFINRKNWPSYNVMAIVDHLYRFRYAICKHAGSSHDATVLKDSALYKNADNMLPKNVTTVEDVEVPCVLLGDPAYPLLPWLITDYKGPNVTPEEESFNVYVSRGRVVIENAFGRLKARFRCLQKGLDINYKFVPNVVLTCMILHNIVETRKDAFRRSWLEAVEKADMEFQQPDTEPSRDYDSFSGANTRNTLKNYMGRFPLRTSRII